MVRLCRSIARVCGLEIYDLSDADQGKSLTAEADLPGDIKLIRTLGFGCVMVIEALWERLGIGKTLRYDTATASFSIDQEDEAGLHRFGRAKVGNWGPQVVVALAVTREGLPVRCWTFPGNTTDVDTVEQVRKNLRGWKLLRALFVADAGMNSQDNQQELSRACGKYLLASRVASVGEIRDTVLSKRGRHTVFTENLHAKEVTIGDGECRKRYILCYNPKEADMQKKHRSLTVEVLEKELARHSDKKATAQWAIELLALKRDKRYLSITDGSQIRIDYDKIRKAEKSDGKWELETNDDTISLKDAACGYKRTR